MADDLMAHADEAERARVGKKLMAEAARLRAESEVKVPEKLKVDAAAFTRETSERMIRQAWASIGREPPPGLLISPWLFAYLKRENAKMGKHLDERAREAARTKVSP